MVHTIIKYDRRDNGQHVAACGKTLTPMDKFNFDHKSITCPQCKTAFIENNLRVLDKQISLYEKAGVDSNFIKGLREKKEYYSNLSS